MRQYYCFIYCFFLFWSATQAQSKGQVNVLMDSTSFLLGDEMRATVVVNVPKGHRAELPDLTALFEEEKLEILELEELKRLSGDVNDTYSQSLLFTAWEPGQYQIPSIPVQYKRNETPVGLESDPIALKVVAPQVTGDSLYIADIKPILAEGANIWDKLWEFFSHPVVVACLILLLAAGIGYLVWQYRLRQQSVPQRSPEEIALADLEALKASDLLERRAFQEFHTQISKILRTYFNQRLEIAALEQPTSFFLPALKQHPYISNRLFEELATVLRHADLIKYAKASPLDIANAKALDISFELVHSVQHQLEVAAENEPKTAAS